MNKLLKLLAILQLTKEQPCTGYMVAGIKHNQIPSLAEHHYNCTLMAYFLGQKLKQANSKINERKLILLLMFHDLSELFGGDISGPLNRKYPDLKEHKDKIGDCAIDLLSGFSDDTTRIEMKKLYEEFELGNSDEKWVAKIIDQMEHQFFLEHHNYANQYKNSAKLYRDKFVEDHIFKLTEKIKDEKTKKVMTDFLVEFKNNFYGQGWQAIVFLMNDNN